MHYFEPLKNSYTTDEVFNQLKNAILCGHVRKGEKLPSERELAKLFTVSRGAVREAIRGLQESGFIEIKHGPFGGAIVKENSGNLLESGISTLYFSNNLTISEVGRFRQFIEPQIARLAALNVTDDYRRRLESALDIEKRTDASIDEYIQRLTAIHLIIAEMCDNGILKNMLNALISLTHQIIKVLSPEVVYSLHRAGEHDHIVTSVLIGDPEGAEKSMSLHSNSFSEAFIKIGKVSHHPSNQN